MKLDYNILWYEDEKDWVEPTIDALNEQLSDLGFRLCQKVRSSGDKSEDLIVDPKVDLLLVDFGLGEKTGLDIIKHFRKKKIYTEVVFYSAKGAGKLREEITERGAIDGVYCLGRNEDFLTTLLEIIHTTIKKVQDINSLRGLVMAGVGDCDLHLQDAIKARYLQSDEEGKEELLKKIKQKIVSAQEQPRNNLNEALERGDIDGLLKTSICPSATMAKIMLSVIKPIKSESHVKPLRSKLCDYEKDVLKPRNNLAHCREGERKGKPVLITLEGEKKFGDEEFSKIRRDLIDHTGNLINIKSLVEKKQIP